MPSRTTTVEVENGSLQHVLQAYQLHHSGIADEQRLQLFPRRPAPHLKPLGLQTVEALTREDQNSLSSRRRIPPYRETSRNHSLSSRPAGLDAASEVIVPAMFFGVFLQQVRTFFGSSLQALQFPLTCIVS